jgi:hypothetical protein
VSRVFSDSTAVRIWLAVWLLGWCGCGGQTVSVSGRVKFKDGSDASVLAGYGVTFEPTEGKASSMGEVQPNGTFTLSTFGANDGAVPGKYQVVVTPPASPDPDKPPQKSKIPAKYADFSTSGLTVEIKPGQKEVELELERAP